MNLSRYMPRAVLAARHPSGGIAPRLADFALAANLFGTPLLLGGRHDAGRLFYVVTAAFAALAAMLASSRRRSTNPLPAWPLALLGAAIALLVLQLTPLPSAVLAAIGPDLSVLASTWGEAAPFGPWTTLSLYPAATAQGLVLLIGHGLLLTACLLRLRERSDLERLMRWIAIATIGMLVVGVVQYAAFDRTLLGVYRHPQRDYSQSIQGTFTNRNHFAHFLILGLGPVCWLAGRAKQPKGRSTSKRAPHGLVGRLSASRIAAYASVSAMLAAITATQSRGGVAVACVTVALLAGLAYRVGSLRLKHVVAGAGVAIAVLVGVTCFDYDRVTRRIDDLVSGDVEQLDATHARRSIWMANLAALRASPLTGFGAGSHAQVYPLFIERGYPREFTHAESSYLQVASETGGAGLALVAIALLGLGATLVRGIRRRNDPESTALWPAIAAGLAASAVHSVFDFVWYLPGLTATTLALAAAAIRLERLARPADARSVATRPANGGSLRLGLATAGAALAITLAARPAASSADWDRFLRRSVSLRAMAVEANQATDEAADPMLAATMQRTLDETIGLLEAVVRADPTNARAHQRLAARLMQLYELRAAKAANGMSVDLIRDAAVHGGFATHADRQRWLSRALGDGADLLRRAHRHAKTAVRLAPLQGKAYLHLASLSFLDAEPIDTSLLVRQAVRLRPNNGSVLFEAGRQQWVAGDPDDAVALWRRSLGLPGTHVAELVGTLARLFPASVLIEQLEPGLRALEVALKQYRVHGDAEDLIALCDHVTTRATAAEAAGEESPLVLAYRWRQVSQTLRSLGRADEAVSHAEHAAELEPYSFPMRHELATALHEAERFEEADPHLRWCLARRPDLRYLHRWLQEGARRRTTVDRNRRSRHRLYAALADKPAEEAPPAEPDGAATTR